MPDIEKAFTIVKKVDDGATATQSDLIELRRILKEMDRDLKLAEIDKKALTHKVRTFEEQDANKHIADLEDQLKRSNWLKEGYLKTIDKAMTCVEAVIATVCGADKSEIKGYGAEFFADAAFYLPKKIEGHVNYVKLMLGDRRCEEAETLSKTLKKERNDAVRKQLDREQTIRKLNEQIEGLKRSGTLELAEARAKRISELTVELNKALLQASEARETAVTKGCALADTRAELTALEGRCEAVARAHESTVAALRERIHELEDADPMVDTDIVSALIERCGKLVNPSGDGLREAVVFEIGTQAHRAKLLDTEIAELRTRDQKLALWLEAIGKHLELQQGYMVRWWETPDALERLRVRVTQLRDGNTKAIEALEAQITSFQTQIEQLTDVIHDLRKEKP